MKTALLLALTTLFFAEEPSYNFGGRFVGQHNVALTIDVRDGSYWVSFTNSDSVCTFSEKAAVKHGVLRIRSKPGKQTFTMLIRATHNTQRMVVQGAGKSDHQWLTHFCEDRFSLAGEYVRLLPE